MAAEMLGLNSLAAGLKEKDFASGFNLEALGRGGCPLSDGLEDAAHCKSQFHYQHAAHHSKKSTYTDKMRQS